MSTCDTSAAGEPHGAGFRPVGLVLFVLVALLLVFNTSDWYAAQVLLPRYCQQPELALQRLAAVVATSSPVGAAARRDHMIAAKLAFLVPRTADEAQDVYLARVRGQLEQLCR